MATQTNWQELQNKNKVNSVNQQQINPQIIGQPTVGQKQEQTWGGFNYNLNKNINQVDNQQGHYNALNGTGHVAGIPERPNLTLQPEQKGKAWQGTTIGRLTDRLPAPATQKTTSAGGGTRRAMTQPQQPAELEGFRENGVRYKDATDRNAKTNGAEFGGLSGAKQQEQPQEEQPQTEENRPEMDLGEREGGVIFGRASGDAGSRIETEADPYSPEAMAMAGRQGNYKALQGMNSYDVAVSIATGFDPYGSQAMRDLRQYDPGKYQEIQDYIKQIQGEEDINSIAKTGTISKTSQTEKATDTINNSITSWVNQNSTERNSSQVQSLLTTKLSNSQVANSATQEMLNINAQIAEIQERMENLPNEAKSVFKGDVPQYFYDAYVSNQSQALQSELNKLQSRYNGAIDLYKTELANKQRETEIELKKAQMESDNNYRNWQMFNADRTYELNKQQQYWNQDYMNKKLRYDNIKEIDGESYILDENGRWTRLSEDVAYQSYVGTVQETMQNYTNMFPDGTYGGQCEAFTDAFTYQTTGLKMEGANGRAYTTAEEKIGYVNSYTPKVGSVAVFDYGIKQSDGQNYGHTMLVAGYDPSTGIVTLKGSNKSKKEGEYERVYSQTMPISQLMNQKAFYGFRDPYMSKVEQSYGESANTGYDYYATAMQPVFAQAYKQASTEAERKAINDAEDSYAIMNELVQGGYIDKLANSDLFNTLISQISNKKFTDGEGNINWSKISEYARNKLKDEDIAYAMDRFHRLIEKKLRKESGAAISQSEWNSNFDMYLPAIGQNPEYRYKKLIALERDIVAGQLPSNYRTSYIPLISGVSNTSTSGRQIRGY